MRRIPLPTCSSIQSFNDCTSSIIDLNLKQRLLDISNYIEATSTHYFDQATLGTVYTIPPLKHPRGADPFIVADVLKSELVNLYDYNMVKRNPGRVLYDKILVAADEKCPFCGGIGRPRSLDHYLPKANYPQFSVLPQNLVPSCRDCNTDKSNDLAEKESKQPIHPYFDADKFFLDQWIFAKVLPTAPCSILYHTTTPTGWSDAEANRVSNHFKDFDIAKRYSIQAAEELGTLIDQRRGYLSACTPSEFSDYLASVANANSLFANHWKKIMYQTLAADLWFCCQTF